jgi:hypothetical protein
MLRCSGGAADWRRWAGRPAGLRVRVLQPAWMQLRLAGNAADRGPPRRCGSGRGRGMHAVARTCAALKPRMLPQRCRRCPIAVRKASMAPTTGAKDCVRLRRVISRAMLPAGALLRASTLWHSPSRVHFWEAVLVACVCRSARARARLWTTRRARSCGGWRCGAEDASHFVDASFGFTVNQRQI